MASVFMCYFPVRFSDERPWALSSDTARSAEIMRSRVRVRVRAVGVLDVCNVTSVR